MKILTLSFEFPPIGGGGSRVVKGLSAKLVEMGHTVDVVTMGFPGLPSTEVVDGVTVYRVECGRKYKSRCSAWEALRYVLGARRVVRRLLLTRAYDLVHVHFIFPDGLLALGEAVPRSVPFIITAHGSDVPGYNQKLFFRIAHPLLKIAWRRVTRHAAAIVSPSKTLANLIALEAPEAPVVVVPNGIDQDSYRPMQKREQILIATRLVERKGVQYLLKALAGLENPWPAIVVGSGEYESELVRLNDKLGRPARLVGWLDNKSAEFRQLLEQSAIYILPSDFENFPISLLEAMAAGSAIITTKGHGCEEVVGDSGELVTRGCDDNQRCIVEIRSALERLMNQRSHREECSTRARERLEQNFTWGAIAASYMGVYEKFVFNGAKEPVPISATSSVNLLEGDEWA